MKITEISSNLQQFSFPSQKNQIVDFNVYFIHSKKSACLIDSGLKEHGGEIKEYFTQNKIETDSIIFSHYHSDHISGYTQLPKCKVFGSSLYSEMLLSYNDLPDPDKFIPCVNIKEQPNLNAGGFETQLIETPSHSPCSIITIIDNKYLHLGDIIINSENGKPVLPLACYELIDNYIKTLNILEQYTHLHWLLGHGFIDQSVDAKLSAVRDRKQYLQNIKNTNGDITNTQALAGCFSDFQNLHWHDYNLLA